jgi:hypothetical protein
MMRAERTFMPFVAVLPLVSSARQIGTSRARNRPQPTMTSSRDVAFYALHTRMP